MDILGTLQNDYDDLCEEDLAMIEEELAVGSYPYDYVEQCRLHIMNITHHFEEKKREQGYIGNLDISPTMVKTEAEVTVVAGGTETQAEQKEKEMTKSEILHEKLVHMRSAPEPEKNFRLYMQTEEYITNDFIDNNFSEFSDTEKIILLREREFDEDFLEKYFAALDHTEIALHQLFSEEFFMRHYKDMPVKLVLTRSRNQWRLKAKRSSKLATFLRLKGVRI